MVNIVIFWEIFFCSFYSMSSDCSPEPELILLADRVLLHWTLSFSLPLVQILWSVEEMNALPSDLIL